MSFIQAEVESYLNHLMPIQDPLLKELYEEGIKDEIPIIQVPSIRFIELLIKMVQPKTIIEVGAAIGFSTIWIAKALPDAVIHTIERKPLMAERARENIKKAGLEDRIILHEGDAINIIPTLPSADFVFIDAAKGKYKQFFDLIYPLVKTNGIMAFDNILFRGYVADSEIANSKPMLRKIRAFNDFIATTSLVETSFIPIGDGLALCRKMEETS